MSAPARASSVGAPRSARVGTMRSPKVTGTFAYSSDLEVAGMLWGHTVRSPHAHARVVGIDASDALRLPGVHAVLTHEDVPGKKTYGLEFADQPVFAFERVRYFGEAVAVVAAEEPEQARRAAAAVHVEYEPLDPVVDPEARDRARSRSIPTVRRWGTGAATAAPERRPHDRRQA